jgi:hypothetical protein
VSGQLPSPRTFNPDIPDGVMNILRAALQRDSSRRFASASEMGAACEHYLYDKGYGPTNLTLKRHLYDLFTLAPAGAEGAEPRAARAPDDADRTPVSHVDVTFTRAGPAPPGTPTPPSRRSRGTPR